LHTCDCRHVPRLKFVVDCNSEEQRELEATFERLAQDRQSLDV